MVVARSILAKREPGKWMMSLRNSGGRRPRHSHAHQKSGYDPDIPHDKLPSAAGPRCMMAHVSVHLPCLVELMHVPPWTFFVPRSRIFELMVLLVNKSTTSFL